MKIYQIHEHKGEWEDYRDRIIGSYLKRERAEEEILKAEMNERKLRERYERCIDCPFVEDYVTDIKTLLAEYPDYCTEAKLESGDYGISCENYYVHFYDADFEIEEVEVIE